MSNPPMLVTNSIRTLRFMKGEMSQAELGRCVGLTRQTIAAIESGRYSPSLDVAFAIADVFGKRLDEVFVRVANPAGQSAPPQAEPTP